MKIVFVGHSHIACIERASKHFDENWNATVIFVQLRRAIFGKPSHPGKIRPSIFELCDERIVARHLADASSEAALTVLCPTGNEHSVCSMLNRAGNDEILILKNLESAIQNYQRWLEALIRYTSSPLVVLPPPPPIESEQFILNHPGLFTEKLIVHGVAPAQVRLRAWLHQRKLIENMSNSAGIRLLELPDEVFSNHGFLHPQYWGKDPTHGNTAYGKLILRHVIHFVNLPSIARRTDDSANHVENTGGIEEISTPALFPGQSHPYMELPDSAFWKQAVAKIPYSRFDPVGDVPFKIFPTDKIATAGSCFAQHISKKIKSEGFSFLTMENPATNGDDNEKRYSYDFSARYGNIYTARQLLQLFDRALGYFSPLDSYWTLPENRFCDPFRPRIDLNGFPSVEALILDRQCHLQAVQEMFRQLDVFIFTLGLTECWVSRLDGAAFPLAPGVAGGIFDSSRYEFVNFDVNEVVLDLQLFIHKLRLVNPQAKLILTVSPVPLIATYESRNVLVSTTYSKSVLRVAAEMVSHSCQEVYYFPSFEIITGNFNRGRYFGPDLRSITVEGLDHVMSVFMRHLTAGGSAAASLAAQKTATEKVDADTEEMMALAEADCDEELLARE